MKRVGIEKLPEGVKIDYRNPNDIHNKVLWYELSNEDIERLFCISGIGGKVDLVIYQSLPIHLIEEVLENGSDYMISNLLCYQEIPSDLITKYWKKLVKYDTSLVCDQKLLPDQVEELYRINPKGVCWYQDLPESILEKAREDEEVAPYLELNYRYNPSLLEKFKEDGKLVGYCIYNKEASKNSVIPPIGNCQFKIRCLRSTRLFMYKLDLPISCFCIKKCIIPEDTFFRCSFYETSGDGVMDYIVSKRVTYCEKIDIWRRNKIEKTPFKNP